MYQSIIRPILFRFDPEVVHETISRGLFASEPLLRHINFLFCNNSSVLSQTLHGINFTNPIGLAAGFDKYGMGVPVWPHLGFGFAEIGTITGQAQDGNPRPRLFRLPENKALINRFGFNNHGADQTAQTLAQWKRENTLHQIPLGINIGKTKIVSLDHAVEDYAYTFSRLFDYGDYFVVNVSSPNTPNLRKLQDKAFLDTIFSSLMKINREQSGSKPLKPLFVKIAPDLTLSQIDDVLSSIENHKLHGIIATNTTITRENINSKYAGETGGLSGFPLRGMSTEVIRYIHKGTSGKLTIIGAGGVFTAEDVYEKIKAGASLIQIYTGFIYEGPRFCYNLNAGLSELMKRDGVQSIRDIN